jgi:hypothetical protein
VSQESHAAAAVRDQVSSPDCDNTYAWLRYAFERVIADPICDRRRGYAWGVVQAAAFGKVLGFARISAIELGVGGGAGLISLERIAARAAELSGVGIDVYGFDTGTGLPKPVDYRDSPSMWFEGQCPMNPEHVARQLRTASLRLGHVRDTIPRFLAGPIAPVGFISFDLDLYSSTVDAMALLRAEDRALLPRIPCYFDNILGHGYSDFTGERLAISEFNASPMRKISLIHGLRHFVPKAYRDDRCWDCMFFAHIFEHRLNATVDALRKPVYCDENDEVYRYPVDSDWRQRIPLN